MSAATAAAAILSERQLRMEDDLGALVRINTFSANAEGQRLLVQPLQALFPQLACSLEQDATGAQHLTLASQGKLGAAPVLLVGHLDTVFPPGLFEGMASDGDLLRGPGVHDMKGGIVVIAHAVTALAETVGLDALPPLRIVLVGDEEVGSPHGKDVIARAAKDAEAALVFESGRTQDKIVVERKGTGSLTIAARGRAAHAGNAHQDGVNAIWMLAEVICKVQKLTNYDLGLTLSAGLVAGGQSKNTVPDEAATEVDFRFLRPDDREAMIKEVLAIAKATEQAFVGGSITVTRGPSRGPLLKTAASVALAERYAASAMRFGLGGSLAPMVGGGSDANTCFDLGVASIDALGPRGKGFHTKDEQIERRTLVPKAQALAHLLGTW
jgi:glutamate carboxypeptidase